MRRTRVEVDKKKCVWCGGCVATCPFDALTLRETVLEVDERCTGCGICVRFCPMGALGEEA
ncbi:MAG TPA: 4Fe-4S binding protein [Thermoplasmata archaeon]|nr:4Fe-4S binding protein [Thermoplasmata archaeon]